MIRRVDCTWLVPRTYYVPLRLVELLASPISSVAYSYYPSVQSLSSYLFFEK